MTKKHFIELADKLKAMKPVREPSDSPYARGFNHGESRNWCFTVEQLADFCQAQNPRFNRERWLQYINGECGKNGGKL